jgi:hypothetical protein
MDKVYGRKEVKESGRFFVKKLRKKLLLLKSKKVLRSLAPR